MVFLRILFAREGLSGRLFAWAFWAWFSVVLPGGSWRVVLLSFFLVAIVGDCFMRVSAVCAWSLCVSVWLWVGWLVLGEGGGGGGVPRGAAEGGGLRPGGHALPLRWGYGLSLALFGGRFWGAALFSVLNVGLGGWGGRSSGVT